MAFLVLDQPRGTYVFTEHDPRPEGAREPVQEDVSIVEDFPEILDWPEGERPPQWLGVSRQDPTDYRVFPSTADCASAGYEPVSQRYWTGRNWQEWTQTRPPASGG